MSFASFDTIRVRQSAAFHKHEHPASFKMLGVLSSGYLGAPSCVQAFSMSLTACSRVVLPAMDGRRPVQTTRAIPSALPLRVISGWVGARDVPPAAQKHGVSRALAKAVL